MVDIAMGVLYFHGTAVLVRTITTTTTTTSSVGILLLAGRRVSQQDAQIFVCVSLS